MDVVIVRDSNLSDKNIEHIEAELVSRGNRCRQVLFAKIMIEINGQLKFFYEKEELKPDLVINWLSTRDFRGYELLKAMEAAGILVVNKADGWWASGSDFLTSLVMHRCGIAHPYSWHSPSFAGAYTHRERLEYPLIHLPSGRIGNNSLVQLQDAPSLEARLLAFRSGQRAMDFQKARESRFIGLIQVLVLGGRALVAYSAEAPKVQFTSFKEMLNYKPRTKRALFSLEQAVTNRAESAAKGMGLDFCAVSLYQYADEWEVAGVTACPEFVGVEDNFGVNIGAEFVGWVGTLGVGGDDLHR